MFDFHNGFLELDRVSFGPQVTLNDLKSSGLPIQVTETPSSSSALARGTKIVHLDGAPFLPEFYFLNDFPSLVLLRPAIQYPPRMIDPAERQQFRYMACVRWLFTRLGKPHEEHPGETKYIFPWGSISAIAHLLPKDSCDAGYLALRYRRLLKDV